MTMNEETRGKRIEVLYRNHQWMVQRDSGNIFLVEVLADHPDNLDGGFWATAADLAAGNRVGYTELHHIAEKNWVDMDALEPAARRTLALSGLPIFYDLDAAMADARQYHKKAMGKVA